ncbi:MFS general substrate transporter [Ophiobolus disseminans]|uniref:MFS general substrate transporter n=1 Tax=Ophiobolus disseminans TaxID=1469910 RepID=A0A6A6ZDB0_9PLEO|nr:MFS general substrate transporter [Ophiobolus disseminans]
MRNSSRPDNGNPIQDGTLDTFGKDTEHDRDTSSDGHDTASQTSDKQAGVKRIEAISKSWTTTSLIIAYVALLLIANVTSLEIQVTSLLTPYATSAFKLHSLVSTIAVVQNIVSSVIKPPMGKIADVFGRLEAFSITIVLYTIGYIMQATSGNVRTFASAQIFWAAGFNGLQVLQQIFVADTSDLLNRALYSTIFDIPFLWTVWAGPEIGNKILATISWRWGYAVWAIILPLCFIPLFISLFMNQSRAKKLGYDLGKPFRGRGVIQILKNLWYDLDFFGLILLAAAISLILLPLTLAPGAKGKWRNASMIAMLVVGAIVLIIFPFWERSKKLAPRAFFPPELFKNRTVIVGSLIAFFYFMAFYMSVFPYFYSYLVIVQAKSVVAAGNITRVFSFSSTISSLVVSLLIKYTAHYKYYVSAGAAVYLMGMGLMLAYRNQDASTATLVGTQIAIGIGGGWLNVPVQLGVQASASHQQVAAATTVWLTILEVGGAVGAAISGAIWSTYIPQKLQLYLPPDVPYLPIYGSLLISGDYTLYPAGSPVRIAINRAYQETMRYLLIGALCAAAPILPLTFFLKNYKLDEMEQPVEGLVIGSADGPKKKRGLMFWKR